MNVNLSPPIKPGVLRSIGAPPDDAQILPNTPLIGHLFAVKAQGHNPIYIEKTSPTLEFINAVICKANNTQQNSENVKPNFTDESS